MPTNPQAPGQTRINFQISESEKAELERLAKLSGMKLSAYVRRILENAISTPVIFETLPKVISYAPAEAPRDPAGDALRARAAQPTPPPTAPQPTQPALAKGKE